MQNHVVLAHRTERSAYHPANVFLLACMLFVSGLPNAGAKELSLQLSKRTEVVVDVSPADGSALLLWLPSEHGLPVTTQSIAKQLAAQGVEVWRADLLSALFLPVQGSSLDQVPDELVAELIDKAHSHTGKTVYLISSGRGAITALRGARHWQEQNPGKSTLAGAVLLHPNLYVETPEPGQGAAYLPIASATNMPLFILQPALSPWRWQLDSLIAQLSQGGSSIYVQVLPGIRDRFFFRPDASKVELHAQQSLAGKIQHAVPALRWHADSRAAVPLKKRGASGQLKKEARLKPVTDQPTPALILPQLHGPTLDLQDLKGQVAVVNFWASWCPPCVHEMPSMQRLQEKFANQPFTILAVNMAESESEIKRFLTEKVRVQFPILMDKDGEALKRWKVFAFPTSYVIDKQGQIRYALFGAVEWDQPDIISVIEKLLAE